MGTSPNELATSCGSVPQALPNFQHPSHALLQENNFTQQAYHKYRQRCLKGIPFILAKPIRKLKKMRLCF